MERQEKVGKRLGRFVLWVGTIGVVALVVIVTQRLSDDALALIIGLFLGIAAMVPTIGLGVFLLRREMATSRAITQAPPAATPPVVVVTPQALPGYGVPPSSAMPRTGAQYAQPSPWAITPNQRHFTIVGEAAAE